MKLSLITNAHIYFVAFFITGFIFLVGAFKERFRHIKAPQDTKTLLSIIHLLFQLFLILKVESYRIICLDYLFMYIFGLNFYLKFHSEKTSSDYSHIVLAPLYGLAITSILGCYFIGSNLNFDYFVAAISFIALSLTPLNWNIFKTQGLLRPNKSSWVSFNLGWFFISILTLILIYPIIEAGFLTSPYRFGPDLASYVKQTNYLLSGGTLEEAKGLLKLFDGMPVNDINVFSDATMSWPFAYFFRWGLLGYEVFLAKVNFSSNSYETLFVSMVMPFLLFCGICLLKIQSYIKLNIFFIPLLFLALIFNVNFLNLLYEGFYANLFILMFFSFLLLSFLSLQKRKAIPKSEFLHLLLSLVIIISACLAAYPEAIFFIFYPFIIIFFVFNYIFKNMRRLKDLKIYFLFFFASIISILIIYPSGFLIEWLNLSILQLLVNGGNGYPQPYWASPHEIFGISSIYLNQNEFMIGILQKRNHLSLFFTLSATVFLFYALIRYIHQKDINLKLPIFSAIAMLVISIFFSLIKSHGNNYSYMKNYIFMTPILLCYFVGGLQYFYTTYNKKVFKYISIFLVLLITLNGIIYIYQYKSQQKLISQNLISLPGVSRKLVKKESVIYPLFVEQQGVISNILHRVMYAQAFDNPWIIENSWNLSSAKGKSFFAQFLNNRVYFFVEKSNLNKYSVNAGEVLLDTNDYLLIDLQCSLKDFLLKDNQSLDFKKIRDSVSISKL